MTIIHTCNLCFCHQELKFAGLVATGGEAGAVVALDPNLRVAEMCRQARQMLKGGGEMRKPNTGEMPKFHRDFFSYNASLFSLYCSHRGM